MGLEKIREYAAAVGESATIFSDRAAARREGFSEVPAPPVFAAVFSAAAVATLMFDPEVGIFDPQKGISSFRFVHKIQAFEWFRPALAGDVISTEATLIDATEQPDGRAARVFESRSFDQQGAPLVTARYEGVIPPPKPPEGRSPSRWDDSPIDSPGRVGAPSELGVGDELPPLELTPDRYAPVRYAGASGDFTPFHLDDELARSLGFPGVILHGLYSFAQLARVHTAPFGGDPRPLRSLSGRFRRPARPERAMRARAVVAERRDEQLRTEAEVRQGSSSVIGEAAGMLALPAD